MQDTRDAGGLKIGAARFTPAEALKLNWANNAALTDAITGSSIKLMTADVIQTLLTRNIPIVSIAKIFGADLNTVNQMLKSQPPAPAAVRPDDKLPPLAAQKQPSGAKIKTFVARKPRSGTGGDKVALWDAQSAHSKLYRELAGKDLPAGIKALEAFGLLLDAGASEENLLTIYTRHSIWNHRSKLKKLRGCAFAAPLKEQEENTANPVPSPEKPGKEDSSYPAKTQNIEDLLENMDYCAALLTGKSESAQDVGLRVIARYISRDIRELKTNILFKEG